MIFGDPSRFAIESFVGIAYERLSFRALGFFVLHIGGRRYGVCAPDATLIACPFDEVQRRIARRGNHTAPFATELDAGKIADAFRESGYGLDVEDNNYFGVVQPEFEALLISSRLEWNPGDEAFDDGSTVLHLDVGNRVRLIAYHLKAWKDDYCHDPETLRDVWLEADEFYGILQQWRDGFESEWQAAPKKTASEDQSEDYSEVIRLSKSECKCLRIGG